METVKSKRTLDNILIFLLESEKKKPENNHGKASDKLTDLVSINKKKKKHPEERGRDEGGEGVVGQATCSHQRSQRKPEERAARQEISNLLEILSEF